MKLVQRIGNTTLDADFGHSIEAHPAPNKNTLKHFTIIAMYPVTLYDELILCNEITSGRLHLH